LRAKGRKRKRPGGEPGASLIREETPEKGGGVAKRR
jgi:hypothetical protein